MKKFFDHFLVDLTPQYATQLANVLEEYNRLTQQIQTLTGFQNLSGLVSGFIKSAFLNDNALIDKPVHQVSPYLTKDIAPFVYKHVPAPH